MTDRPTDPPASLIPPPAMPASKPRRRRRWLKILAGLVIFLIALVALLPTIISLGPVRSFAVSQASGYINGRIEIASWSFGWFSPIRIQGVKIYDTNNALVLEADEIKTDLTLSKLARQQFVLGDTVIDANLARLQIRPDGSTNLQDLLIKKSTTAVTPPPATRTSEGEKTNTPSPPARPIEIPNVSGNITLRLRGTVELLDTAGRVASVVQLRQNSGGTIAISDINAPITTDLKFLYDVDNKPQGTITLAGTADAVNNNKIDTTKILDTLVADMKLTLANVDLSAAKSILVLQNRSDTELAGVVDGVLAFKTDGVSALSAEGEIDVRTFGVKDPALSGDSLSIATISMPLKLSRTVSGADAVLKPEKLRIEMPQGFIDVAGEMNQSALTNLATGHAPGSKGWLSVTADFTGVGDFAKQLKNTAKMLPGVTITQGHFGNRTDIAFLESGVTLKSGLSVALNGTDADGKTLAVKPVTVSTDATFTPGTAGFYSVAPDGQAKTLNINAALRGVSDVALVVISDFANVRADGKTLAQLNAKGDADLGKLRDQLAQFSDIGDLKLAGRGNFSLATDGDLSTPGKPVKLVTSGGVEALDITLPGKQHVQVGFAAVDSNATLLTSADAFLAGVQSLMANFSAGDKADAPLAKGKISAENIDLATPSLGRFAVEQFQVADLPAVVRMASPFVPQLAEQKIDVTAGELYLAVGGSYDGKTKTLTLDKPLSLSTPNLTVAKAGQRLLNRENIRVEVVGVVGLPPGGLHAKFDTLTVSSTFASLKKSAEPFEVTMTDKGVTGGGSIPISADLVAINRLVTAWGASAVVTPLAPAVATATPAALSVPPEVRGGKFDGVLQVIAADAQNARLQFDGTVKELTIALGETMPIQGEAITLSASAVSNDAFGNVAAAANVKGSFFTAVVKDTAVNLKPASESVFDQLTKSTITVGSPDLARLFTLAKAFVPSLSANPFEITSGGAALNLVVTRDANTHVTSVRLTDGAVSKLSLKNGEYAYKFDGAKPITFSLAADATALKSIDALKVTQLAFDAGVVQLTMPESISVTDLATSPKASGKVLLTGSIEKIAPLLSVVQGAAPLKYAGLFNIEQRVATAGDAITLTGKGTIDDFAVRDGSNQPTFTEKQLTFANDLVVDTKASSALIKTLTLAMPTSGALDVKIVGGVKDWVKQRAISPGTVATINYDLEKLWPIAYASMSADQQKTFKDAKVLGKYSRVFALGGSYPDAPRWQDSVKSLTMDGRLSIQLFDAAGVKLGEPELDLGMKLAKGQLVTDAKPAGFNGGTMNIGGIVVSIDDDVRVDIAKNQELIANASINPVLGDSLGKYVNPVFANSERAKGLLGVRVVECKALATGEKLHTSQSGSAKIALSIVDMDIANPVGSLLAGPLLNKLGQGDFAKGQADAFQGQIRQGLITIENGQTTQDITMELSRPVVSIDKATGKSVTKTETMPLTFKGDIRLLDLKQKLNLNVPTELLASLVPSNDAAKVLRDVFPEGVPVVMGGTSTAPKIDYGNIFGKITEGLIRSRLNGVGGSDDGKDKNVLGGILDKIGGKKDKDKK